MEQPQDEHAIAENGKEISPPSGKRVKRCIQSKLSWHKPRAEEARAAVVEEEKGKCEEIDGEGKNKGNSPAKTPKKDLKISQSKLPWHNTQVEEAKVVVIEDGEEPPENKEEGKKKGKTRKSQTRTPQKSPAKNKEARRSSARNKSNKNCKQLGNEKTSEDTLKMSPTSSDSDHGGSSSKKSLNKKRHNATKDVDGESMNICCPVDLWLEAKIAAEENLRLSVGKQTHPFFTSRKTAQRLPETQENKKTEMRCWPGLDGDYTVSCPPIHVFDTSKDDIASFDWKSWEFTGTSLSDLKGYCAIENASSVFDLSVKPLTLDNLHREEMHLDQLSNIVDEQRLYVASAKSTSVDGHQLDAARLSNSISLSLEHFCCVDNLENSQEDKVLTGRLTSYYQRISCWPGCSLWTNKYQPENALEVCGNNDSVRFLSEWLKSWSERVLQSSNKKNIVEHCVTEDSEDSSYETESDMDDETTLKNVLLITGTVGSGKSAAIYACAKEQGFEVIEVNTSDVRNGAHMKQEFGQALESHALNKWSAEDPNGHERKCIFDMLSSPADIGEDEELGNGSIEMLSRSLKQDATQAKSSCNTSEKVTISQTADKTLILFEDVDTVFDEDHGFISSILHLAKTAKRPIILTSNYRKPVLPQLLDRFVLNFTSPTSEELLSHLRMICASEKAYVPFDMLERLVRSCLGDIRKILMLLQFWCQGKGLQRDRDTQVSYGPLAFDTDAAYLVMPRLIPWELQCKLSEKVGEEIDRTIAIVEENMQLVETKPQELNSEEMINLPKRNEAEVATPIKCRKRALFKRNSSFIEDTEFLDCAHDIEDFSNSDPPGTNGQVRAEVATPIKRRKRALFRRNSSFIEDTEFLDCAHDIEDFSNASDPPGTNGQLRVKRRNGIVLSSQSDDGSADERPCTETVNGFQMPDFSTIPISQTAEVPNFLELPIDHICRYEREDTVRQQLENFETTSVSHICDTFRLQDVSCVPESSFTFGAETNREDDFLAISSHDASFIFADSITPIHDLPGDASSLDRNIIELRKCLEDNAGNTCDRDAESVNGNEEQRDFQNGDESPSYKYLVMDECSRVDFSMRLLPGSTGECSPEVDLVQETWRKLRRGRDDLKAYLPANKKDIYLTVNHVSGLADLISEADIMFKSFYPLTNDILEPLMIPCVEPEICSFYEEQMEMGSTYAQHGLCFYANKLAEVGSSLGHAGTMDLAQEMIASSMNTMALGKQLSKGSAAGQNSQLEGSLHITRPRCSIPTGREMESELYDALLCTVPARLSLVLRDSAFHEYVSFLCKLSRLECSRLSQTTGGRRRSRRHYLSCGSLSLSNEQVQLLAQSGCFKSFSDLSHGRS